MEHLTKQVTKQTIEHIVQYTLGQAANKAKWVPISDYAADNLDKKDCTIDKSSILNLKNKIVKHLINNK
jgi:hypothetical protein